MNSLCGAAAFRRDGNLRTLNIQAANLKINGGNEMTATRRLTLWILIFVAISGAMTRLGLAETDCRVSGRAFQALKPGTTYEAVVRILGCRAVRAWSVRGRGRFRGAGAVEMEWDGNSEAHCRLIAMFTDLRLGEPTAASRRLEFRNLTASSKIPPIDVGNRNLWFSTRTDVRSCSVFEWVPQPSPGP
jgi:hypothetical protein